MKKLFLASLTFCATAIGVQAQNSVAKPASTSVFAPTTSPSASSSNSGGIFTGAGAGSEALPADAHWGSLGLGQVITVAPTPATSGQLYYFKQSALWAGGQKGTRLRLGLGLNFRSGTTKDSSQNAKDVTTTSFTLSPRGGYEMLNQVANRFTIGYGGEAGIDYTSTSTKYPDPTGKVGSSTFGIGAGPIGSAYWMASQYLMVGVESVFYLYYNKTSHTPGSATESGFNVGLLPVYRVSLALRLK